MDNYCYILFLLVQNVLFQVRRQIDFHKVIFASSFFLLQDMFRLETPGGGGYGSPDTATPNDMNTTEPPLKKQRYIERGSVHEYTRAQEAV